MLLVCACEERKKLSMPHTSPLSLVCPSKEKADGRLKNGHCMLCSSSCLYGQNGSMDTKVTEVNVSDI